MIERGARPPLRLDVPPLAAPPARRSGRWELLPLVLLGLQLGIAVGIELVAYDTLLGWSKLPLVGLLGWAFLAQREQRLRGPGAAGGGAPEIH